MKIKLWQWEYDFDKEDAKIVAPLALLGLTWPGPLQCASWPLRYGFHNRVLMGLSASAYCHVARWC